uniref:Uncharacterized protein n=1 Tax=Anopheles quadriannulatus TaxID=34691 RepID=A0A182XRV3_ANOQN
MVKHEGWIIVYKYSVSFFVFSPFFFFLL